MGHWTRQQLWDLLHPPTINTRGALAAFNAGYDDGLRGVKAPSRMQLAKRFDEPRQYTVAHKAGANFRKELDRSA